MIFVSIGVNHDTIKVCGFEIKVIGLDGGEFYSNFKEYVSQFKTLYDVLGFEFHSQQQGQCTITYQGYKIAPTKMEDTCGTVDSDTMVLWGAITLPLGSLTSNMELDKE